MNLDIFVNIFRFNKMRHSKAFPEHFIQKCLTFEVFDFEMFTIFM